MCVCMMVGTGEEAVRGCWDESQAKKGGGRKEGVRGKRKRMKRK